MKMYIIRHGQTPWNARKCLQGRSDVDLNENGIYLAELTGKALRDVTFDMAFPCKTHGTVYPCRKKGPDHRG